MTAVSGLGVALRRPGGETLPLVEDVSFAVAPGRILGVVGETGAGKTLTMRATLGLSAPALAVTGHLTLPDGDVVDLADRAAVRALLGDRLSVVLQDPLGMLDPLFRVGDQLIEGVCRAGRMTSGEARGRAERLLEAMGFVDVAAVQRLFPHELSGGMAQRVATALAMMARPSLLVLDEPTSALDASVRVEVMRLVRQLAAEERIGVCLVSHDLGVISHFADALMVMYAGRVLEARPADEALHAPAHPYTRALIASSPSLDAPRRRPLPVIHGAPPVPGTWPGGCVFEPRCPRAADRCRGTRPALEPSGAGTVACHYRHDAEDARHVTA
ncbi:MAG TPA: ABC transporter ATP-binding protein [Baekduia sp.]|uniref:ABC transporter ATP-binding protein n=1 Tax=Baekduia sp. TaxID=2600305 RepID=UPI002D784A0D|nr:ABC transporter ATP-binding protein [Baekduia sp.]HET6507840.1 ABC transporter ATP-binding protein [Baekduia sp.]